MAKLSISLLKASHSLEHDAKIAFCRSMSRKMQSKVLGGAVTNNDDRKQICDAVCYPEEMGTCQCWENLA